MVRSKIAVLHDGPRPFRLVNAWDACSARVLAGAGAPAIGTTSFGVAASLGATDGEHLPWATMRAVVASIVAAVDVPVTADIVAGWGDVGASVSDVVAAGAVGINLEDSRPDAPGQLFDTAEQRDRLAAARAAGGPNLFVNARCDVWFGAAIDDAERLDAASARVEAYASAGADGIFVPGLVDPAALRVVADAARLPVNVLADPRLLGDDELADAGVRRISQGAGAFLAVVQRLDEVARAHLHPEQEAPA